MLISYALSSTLDCTWWMGMGMMQSFSTKLQSTNITRMCWFEADDRRIEQTLAG